MKVHICRTMTFIFVAILLMSSMFSAGDGRQVSHGQASRAPESGLFSHVASALKMDGVFHKVSSAIRGIRGQTHSVAKVSPIRQSVTETDADNTKPLGTFNNMKGVGADVDDDEYDDELEQDATASSSKIVVAVSV